MTRAVELLGIGSDNLRAVPLDGLRRMRPDALAAAIDDDLAAGVTPIAVIATAGTTLTGAIDPLAELAEVCAERGVWLHVDGAYGLPAAAGPRSRRAVRRARARRLLQRRRPQVALPAEGVRRGARPRRRRRSPGRSRTSGLPAAPAARAARRRHHARVLAALPRAEALARVPGPRRRRSSARRSHGTSTRPTCCTAARRRRRTSRSPDAPPQLSIVPIRHAPAGRRRPRRPQRAPRRRDPGRRPRLPRLGAHRRPGLAPAVLRELPHDRGGRARDPRGRARPGRRLAGEAA